MLSRKRNGLMRVEIVWPSKYQILFYTRDNYAVETVTLKSPQMEYHFKTQRKLFSELIA